MRAFLLALVLLIAVASFTPAAATYASVTAPDTAAMVTAQEEAEEGPEDLPWIPIVILAFIVPTAALLIPAFLMVKGRSASESTD